MLLSSNWLKDYIKIPGNVSAEDLGKLLTLRTVEVEKITKQGEELENVVIGKILELKKHPDAERLQLVKVDVGKNKLDIVCGAQNIKIGDYVPVALIGAKLPNGMEIKEAVIRGEKSFGMLCAPDELGLGKDHSGIFILEDGKLGMKLTEFLKLDDVIYEVDNKSLTNRPDLWGHQGMARDISAILNTTFKEYKLNLKTLKKTGSGAKLEIRVEDKKACPRYMAVSLENIEIKESPEWIKSRLSAVGLRAINNVVDATNYVMLDLGQPMHAFDKNLVDKINVRWAKSGEVMSTLDGQERKLEKDMLVVADSRKPIAIAGVMGGADSEIKENTDSIILEAATWEPVQIRKTSQKLGLRTESSMRFEKSLDTALCPLAIARAIEIIKETCPQAKICSSLIDIFGIKSDAKKITLDLEWVNDRLGEKIEKAKILNILKQLGFKFSGTGKKILVTVPSWRATKDISIAEDLVEEIARIYGYDNLYPDMPKIIMKAPEINLEKALQRKIKNIFALGAGFSEVYNYSFIGEDQIKKLKINSQHLRLINPLASNQNLLRQSLVPNLLENIRTNQANYDEISLFEIGDVFMDEAGAVNKGGKSKEKLPLEKRMVGIICAGIDKEKTFFKLKGALEFLFEKLDMQIEFIPVKIKSVWSDIEAEIKSSGKIIGRLSLVDSSTAREIGVKKEVAVAEFDFNILCELFIGNNGKRYVESPKYPSVIRDLAFVVKSDLLYNEIKESIESSSALVKSVELFDIYQGEKIGENKKNLAFHVIYQDENKTLSAEEADNEQKKIIKTLEEKFGAQVRNF